jgi:hypothetical protein
VNGKDRLHVSSESGGKPVVGCFPFPSWMCSLGPLVAIGTSRSLRSIKPFIRTSRSGSSAERKTMSRRSSHSLEGNGTHSTVSAIDRPPGIARGESRPASLSYPSLCLGFPQLHPGPSLVKRPPNNAEPILNFQGNRSKKRGFRSNSSPTRNRQRRAASNQGDAGQGRVARVPAGRS